MRFLELKRLTSRPDKKLRLPTRIWSRWFRPKKCRQLLWPARLLKHPGLSKVYPATLFRANHALSASKTCGYAKRSKNKASFLNSSTKLQIPERLDMLRTHSRRTKRSWTLHLAMKSARPHSVKGLFSCRANTCFMKRV